MIKKIKEYPRFEIGFLLILMTLFCFALSIFRYYISDTKVFFFLNWNLFLAWIPLIISSFLLIFNIKSKISIVFAVIIWILFFPNSPYILTDLFHLKARSSVPIWYDLVVILSFAWAGLMCGFVSLLDIEKLLSNYFKRITINMITIFFLFLSGFGVYLGRFLRWNSWDVLNNPFGLFNDIVDRFINPLEHTKTWGVTILMGILLNFMYFMIKMIRKENNQMISPEIVK
ncbi:Uncharacterized membrane protein [Chryseobacterium soldanellicola]|uniref:Uncharacterized membrane protein n=1 Tax=Chryseobacterium soldanellicola TaxID=311333 RepID=A0A1H0ZS84_9FLAO|nr:DUF1361 domain-containing protein [Chryseobacterium soldanellicola]SDQ29876.1 Uncharacterized membrane protein [Chryseobacterium soldanellicola]